MLKSPRRFFRGDKMTQVTQSSPPFTLALAWFLGHLGHDRSMTQMTQRPTAACPRWRAHRLACHDPNDPTPTADARGARARALQAGGLGAPGSGLALRAGGRRLAAWGGRARGHPVKITGSVRKKFFIF